jgi:thermosome|tara:strand:- start:1514 stop:3133 length:1620 start_codon:yes stop_codon:yes gene_type:complete
MSNNNGQPIFILKEGSSETKGKEAQKNNIFAATLVAQLVKTSLGPRGMDKMLVDGLGDVTITNDGATILKEIDMQHPAGKMMVEVAKTTDSEVGDGTTTSVVFSGALLEKAQELIDKEVHPTMVIDGYARAAEEALDILKKIAIKVDKDDKDMLIKIATTSMMSKLVAEESKELSKIVVDALLLVADNTNGETKIDLENVKIDKKPGASMNETSLIKGIVLDKEVVHSSMPKSISKAKIAIVNIALEIEKTEISAEIRINDPLQMKQFLDEENRMLKQYVDQIVASGANIVICQKGIDDIAQHYLAQEEIMAVRRVKESDMVKIAKATGARIISNLKDLSKDDLGSAALVEERKIETDKWVFIEGCKNPKAVSILIRGGSPRVLDEAERSLHDSLMVVKDVLEYPYIVAGGGAPEANVAFKIRQWANKLTGREQLAAQKFADAIESLPITLAENAGMDAIDTQVNLRAGQVEGKKWYGVDALRGGLADMSKRNVYEPLKVKEQVIKSAVEVTNMILRIDDTISSAKGGGAGGPPGGMDY